MSRDVLPLRDLTAVVADPQAPAIISGRAWPSSTSIRAGAFNSDGLEIETPWHSHDLHQLLYAFEGSVDVEGQSARYKVPHQFAAWIPAGTVHRTVHRKVNSGSVFFHADLIDSQTDGVRVIAAPNLMREMVMYAMRWPIDGVEDEFRRSFFECFAKLCAEWITREVKLVLPSSDDPRITTIIRLTAERLDSISLRDLCQAVNMSERTLRRHFQKAIGISWEDFRLRLRMYNAIEALGNTTRPVGEIALDVGYASQAAFANAFRAMMGMSPAAYRRACR